ncbi:MAG: exodeoxyribonuclease VII small subunit [Acidimicrobiaceae bacterium]|nr:exodeoxyribonuclease VII small subunit [Acidimicrobiaceae bacterium]
MNDIQAEHGDHDDLGEGTNNDHHSNGGDEGTGSEGGDEGSGGEGGDGGGGGEGGIGYADAMAEIEQILRDLEGDDLDVDMLASRVERASFLIGLCRTRIGAARVQVERVVANLDSDDDEYRVEAGSEAETDGD